MVTKNASWHDACVNKIMTHMTRFSDIKTVGESLVRSSMTHMTRFSDIQNGHQDHDAMTRFPNYQRYARTRTERQPEHASHASWRGSQ